jgi:hypothetical protein
MEGAEGLESASGLFQGDVLRYDINDIRAIAYFINNVLRKTNAHTKPPLLNIPNRAPIP